MGIPPVYIDTDSIWGTSHRLWPVEHLEERKFYRFSSEYDYSELGFCVMYRDPPRVTDKEENTASVDGRVFFADLWKKTIYVIRKVRAEPHTNLFILSGDVFGWIRVTPNTTFEEVLPEQDEEV